MAFLWRQRRERDLLALLRHDEQLGSDAQGLQLLPHARASPRLHSGGSPPLALRAEQQGHSRPRRAAPLTPTSGQELPSPPSGQRPRRLEARCCQSRAAQSMRHQLRPPGGRQKIVGLWREVEPRRCDHRRRTRLAPPHNPIWGCAK